MTETRYFKDPDTGVFRWEGFDGLRYSDGSQTESAILEIVRSCSNLRVGSEELLSQIKDWPTEYHFSTARANLLRPFDIGEGNHVLELGCGCGALTRYLGESGALVTAVEGSLMRASITAARCRDLPNVTVVADSIESFKPKNQFDIVTLIGVLEYAPMFISGDNPPLKCLAIARRLLRPGGTLLLAIENQLGLKYFNGCTEDHVGKLFFGLQDQYGASTPVTFGRAELQRLLGTAGFAGMQYLLPFPDYKLPDVLIAEHAQAVPGFTLHNLLARNQDRDYSGRRLQVFDEHLVWRVLARNGLLGNLANSFLIVAGTEEATTSPLLREPWLAKIYATSRRAGWATETTIRLTPSGLRVSKVSLGSKDNGEVRVGPFTMLHQLSPDEPYVSGDLLLHRFQRLALVGDLAQMADLGRQWLSFLFQGRTPATCALGDHQVPGYLIDCIPINLILAETGQLIMIDREWQLREPIPLAWVVLRGLVSVLYQCRFPHDFGRRSCEAVITELLTLMGFTAAPYLYEEVAMLENALQSACGNDRLPQDAFRLALANPVPRLLPLEKTPEIEGFLEQIQAYQGSISWRITKPLRYFASVLRRRGGLK